MSLADVVANALAAEQERLHTLPWERPRYGDWYFSDTAGKLTLDECNYSGQEPDECKDYQVDYAIRKANPDVKKFVTCRRCYWIIPTDMLEDGKLPLHAHALDQRDHAREFFGIICAAAGVDTWSGDALYGNSAVMDSRAETLGGRLATGLPHLVAQLLRADATAATQKEIRELLELEIDGAEHPFFTEATLYELLGKDDARTVLAHTRSLARVSGYTGQIG